VTPTSHGTVIPYRRRGEYKPKADDLRLELEARTAEERNASAKAAPITHLARRSRDPQVMAAALVVAEAFIVRHQRRWTGGDAA
jgi:hypothetical protein